MLDMARRGLAASRPNSGWSSHPCSGWRKASAPKTRRFSPQIVEHGGSHHLDTQLAGTGKADMKHPANRLASVERERKKLACPIAKRGFARFRQQFAGAMFACDRHERIAHIAKPECFARSVLGQVIDEEVGREARDLHRIDIICAGCNPVFALCGPVVERPASRPRSAVSAGVRSCRTGASIGAMSERVQSCQTTFPIRANPSPNMAAAPNSCFDEDQSAGARAPALRHSTF